MFKGNKILTGTCTGETQKVDFINQSYNIQIRLCEVQIV